MKDTYPFDKFCALLSDSLILKTSTALGITYYCKTYIKEIKSEVLKELLTLNGNKNDYLDYLINEVQKQEYVKGASVNYVERWLKEYDITIEEVLNHEKRESEIYSVIDRHYNDMQPFSPEKDEAHLVQSNFLNYFCCYYADQLIDFFNSRKEQNHNQSNIHTNSAAVAYKNQYLNAFCDAISDEREIKQTCFSLLYENSITHYTQYLESEIMENLVVLPSDKKEDYINFAIDKINKTPLRYTEKNIIDKWLNKYNEDVSNFPKFPNTELNQILKTYYMGHLFNSEKDREYIFDIQIDFFCYAARMEAEKMIDFLEKKRIPTESIAAENSASRLKWIGKPSQLGYIISTLAQLGYIEAPEKKDGEINYRQFANLVK